MSLEAPSQFPPAPPLRDALKSRTNVLAIVSLVGAFLMPFVGVICAHISLSQIKRTGERGRSIAIAGLAIGYVSIGLIVYFYILAMIAVLLGALADL